MFCLPWFNESKKRTPCKGPTPNVIVFFYNFFGISGQNFTKKNLRCQNIPKGFCLFYQIGNCCQIMARQLEQAGLKHLPNMENITTIDGMLEQCNAEYLTNGLHSLNKIPNASVDFIWSHSVVEHIRKRDFEKTFRELHRILKDDGQASHNVNLQDHLQYSLNSLRFAESLWESDFFTHSGFYTNRLRCTESLKIMEKAGFRVADLNRGFWESLPLPKTLLHPDFQHFSDEELRTRTYSVLLAKR